MKFAWAPLLALLVVAPAHALTPSNEVDLAAAQWSEVCSDISGVTSRAGAISVGDIAQGLKVMKVSGLTSKIASQSNEEACLSLVASAETGTSIFVINKPDKRNLPPASNPAMPFVPFEEALTAKLEALDLGYFVPAPGQNAAAKYRELYEAHPKEAKRASWHSLMIQTRTTQRSLSVFFKGYCLVIQDTNSIADYSRASFRGDLDGVMSAADQQWLATKGAGQEFWHEAAHCQLSPIGQVTQPQRTDIVMTNVKTFAGQLCSNGFSEQVFNMTLGRQQLQKADLQAYAKDLRILYNIASEAYADDFAESMLVKRLRANKHGCTSAENQVNRPWAKFRLADSINNPSISHITWIAPFLVNQPLENQAQALSDAWAALKEISFDEISVPGKVSLVRKVLTRQSQGAHLTPSPKPDTQRKNQWKAWIKGKLGL